MTDAAVEAPAASPGAIRIAGADAATFLQGQLTQDVVGMADGEARLAGLQTAQGRVIAVLNLARRGNGYTALLPAARVEPVIAHLRRYTLRARVTLEAVGAHAVPAGKAAGLAAVVAEPGAASELHDVGGGRLVLVGEPPPGLAPLDHVPAPAWTLAGIRAGLPELDASTAEAFTAHMLNLDRLGAISFTKGCYTGQEIVARTEHQGRVKRRLLRYALPAGPPPAPLTPLFDGEARAGDVLIAATGDGACECLAVVPLEAAGRELATDDGRRLRPLPLPYPLG
jgi:tRNA-modifying protein YgfZ